MRRLAHHAAIAFVGLWLAIAVTSADRWVQILCAVMAGFYLVEAVEDLSVLLRRRWRRRAGRRWT